MFTWTRFLVFCCGLVLWSTGATAQQIFEWEDEKGGRHYSHVPPPAGSEVAVHPGTTPPPKAIDAPSAPRAEADEAEGGDEGGEFPPEGRPRDAGSGDSGDADYDEGEDFDDGLTSIEEGEDGDEDTARRRKRPVEREEQDEESSGEGDEEDVTVDDGSDREDRFDRRRSSFDDSGDGEIGLRREGGLRNR